MNADQIAKRLAELKELAKQHEAILLQISGAIQEYNRILENMSKEAAQATTESQAQPEEQMGS